MSSIALVGNCVCVFLKSKLPGLYLPGLAELCLSAIKILEWPCAANVYASPSRLEAMDANDSNPGKTYFFKDVHWN